MKIFARVWLILVVIIAAILAGSYVLFDVTPMMDRLASVEILLLALGFIVTVASTCLERP